MTQLTYGNGLRKTLRYDQDYRLTTLADGVQDRRYGYDAASNITKITDVVRPGAANGFDMMGCTA